jgi:hypothetical protein
MSTTTPAFQQSGFATNQFSYPVLLNELNSNDRSFLKDLIRKYGSENYGLWQLLMGKTATYEYTNNKQFYHYEKRELHSSLSVKETVAATGAGNALTFVVGLDSYFDNGIQCAARLNEEVQIDSTNVACWISAIPATTQNAWQVTITPKNTTDIIASAGTNNTQLLATEVLKFKGIMDIGEASNTQTGLAPVYDKIYNTTTEHRDDFTSTDFVSMEKQEVVLANGQQYYRYLGMDDMNRRYMNDMFFKVIEANGANAQSANGTFGTIGVEARVEANGSIAQYTAGAPTISDFHTLGRILNFYGSPGEYHALTDFYAKQAVSDLLFTTYKNTFEAATYESFDGDGKEAAAAYGFDSFKCDNISYHFCNNPMYNTPQVYKRNPGLAGSANTNKTLLIPQRVNQVKNEQNQFESMPSFQIVFQTLKGSRVYTWEYGGAADQNKTGQLNVTLSMMSYFGVRTIAANQFALWQGI